MRKLLTTAALAALCSTAVFAADAKAGKEVYDKSCKTCHGPTGTPPAGMAKAMGIKDFTEMDLTDAADQDGRDRGQRENETRAGGNRCVSG